MRAIHFYRSFFLINLLFINSLQAPYRDIPIGLTNCGDSCYMNSALQLLYNMRSLVTLIMDHAHEFPANSFIASLNAIFIKMSSPEKTALTLEDLDSFYENTVVFDLMQLSSKQQADAGEFLTRALEKIRDEIEKQGSSSAKEELSNIIIERKLKFFFTDVSAQPKMIESIAIKNFYPYQGHLEEAIYNQFATTRTVEFPTKQTIVEPYYDLPNYYIFSISLDKLGNWTFTIPKFLTLETITDSHTYQLSSTIAHAGSIQSGHYIALVRRGNTWYECNDSTIRSLKQLEIPQGFVPLVFLYRKISIKPKAQIEPALQNMAQSMSLMSELVK